MGGSLGPLDAQLLRALPGILESQSQHAPFWAMYIGAVASLVATVLPVFPKNPDDVKNAIRSVIYTWTRFREE